MTVPISAVDVFLCSAVDQLALIVADKALRIPPRVGASGLDLNKNQPVLAPDDQVYLRFLPAVISRYNIKPFFGEEFCSEIFANGPGFNFIGHPNVIPLISEFTTMSSTKKYIEGFTRQLADALKIAGTIDLVRPGSDIRNVVITGMGGSGISANLVESLTFGRIPIPITVCKSYNIPQFVNPHTLFIACSYSGNTEETIAALNKALLKRAQCIAIASGGKLLDIAREYNLFYIQLPGGSASPRAMLGYNMIALMSLLYHTNLIGAAFIKETENAIEFLNRGVKGIESEAELIAKKLKGKLPVIYCDSRLYAMALRFQQQLNENSKHIAHVNTFPEMNHNELVGWKFPENLMPMLQVIYLYSDHDHERVEKRMEICREIFEKKSNPIIDVIGEGASLLEQYYYLIHLTDWISFYLAKENGIEPDPIESIKYLKTELDKLK